MNISETSPIPRPNIASTLYNVTLENFAQYTNYQLSMDISETSPAPKPNVASMLCIVTLGNRSVNLPDPGSSLFQSIGPWSSLQETEWSSVSLLPDWTKVLWKGASPVTGWLIPSRLRFWKSKSRRLSSLPLATMWGVAVGFPKAELVLPSRVTERNVAWKVYSSMSTLRITSVRTHTWKKIQSSAVLDIGNYDQEIYKHFKKEDNWNPGKIEKKRKLKSQMK